MTQKRKQSGFTLVEMLVALVIVILVGTLGLVSIHALMESFESQGSVKSLVSSALSNARATAAKEGTYAGIRFQREFDPDGINKASQYMILIKKEGSDIGTDADVYVAVAGKKPIKIPDGAGIMDMRLGSVSDAWANASGLLDEDHELRDTHTFSIIYSPSGRIVRTVTQVRNRDGVTDLSSRDTVFNVSENVLDKEIGFGQFVQDYFTTTANTPNDGLEQESSRKAFVIYDRQEFDKLDPTDRFDYIVEGLGTFTVEDDEVETAKKVAKMIFLNPFTGEIIENEE